MNLIFNICHIFMNTSVFIKKSLIFKSSQTEVTLYTYKRKYRTTTLPAMHTRQYPLLSDQWVRSEYRYYLLDKMAGYQHWLENAFGFGGGIWNGVALHLNGCGDVLPTLFALSANADKKSDSICLWRFFLHCGLWTYCEEMRAFFMLHWNMQGSRLWRFSSRKVSPSISVFGDYEQLGVGWRCPTHVAGLTSM